VRLQVFFAAMAQHVSVLLKSVTAWLIVLDMRRAKEVKTRRDAVVVEEGDPMTW